MKLEPGSPALTIVLALLISLGPLSTDMYLPSLPAIGRAFSTDAGEVQLTLSLFLVGFAAGQIVYGPLSDRFGRRPVLFAGLAVFVLASLACMAAGSIGVLIGARFAQAVGACAAIVLARAIVRDLHAGEDAARILSFMGALMGLVPAIGPIVGGFLQIGFGWRASFVVTAAFGLALAGVIFAMLPETLDPVRRAASMRIGSMVSDFRRLAAHPLFRRYAGAVCFGYAGLFSFISGSSFVLQIHYRLDEVRYGLSFAVCVLGYIAGTLIGARIARRLGVARTVDLGSVLLAAGGVAMAAAVLIEPPHVFHILVPMTVYMAGVGITLPPATAGAITPFPDRAGTASSLLGFLQMTFAALVGVAVGHLVEETPPALAWMIALMGLGNLGVTLIHRRHHRA